MKNSNEVSLNLEVLEDRLALSGAFGGAIGAGSPSRDPFPFNGLMVQPTIDTNPQPGFRNSFASTGHINFVSQPSFQSQFQSFQSQLQSIQAAQIAMIDQFFSQLETMLQPFNIHTFIIR